MSSCKSIPTQHVQLVAGVTSCTAFRGSVATRKRGELVQPETYSISRCPPKEKRGCRGRGGKHSKQVSKERARARIMRVCAWDVERSERVVSSSPRPLQSQVLLQPIVVAMFVFVLGDVNNMERYGTVPLKYVKNTLKIWLYQKYIIIFAVVKQYIFFNYDYL